MMPFVRTTVTLDDDVVRELKAHAKKAGKVFKESVDWLNPLTDKS